MGHLPPLTRRQPQCAARQVDAPLHTPKGRRRRQLWRRQHCGPLWCRIASRVPRQPPKRALPPQRTGRSVGPQGRTPPPKHKGTPTTRVHAQATGRGWPWARWWPGTRLTDTPRGEQLGTLGRAAACKLPQNPRRQRCWSRQAMYRLRTLKQRTAPARSRNLAYNASRPHQPAQTVCSPDAQDAAAEFIRFISLQH